MDSGELAFPTDGGVYPHGAECEWTITLSDDDMTIGVNIIEMDVEYHSSCAWDHLQVSNIHMNALS